jgi:membrane fusion protein, heavy metal efflux system
MTRTWNACLGAALAAAVVASCRRNAPPDEEAAEPEALSVTRWTPATELFAEYAPLIVGETSRFAIHLTRLSDFKAVADGRAEVRLEGGGAPVETFAADRPSRPGIFGVDVRPAHAGTRTLVIALRARGLSDDHRIDGVVVHPTTEAARRVPAGDEAAPGISFLKEQQWTLDFATAVVAEGTVRESVQVPARVAPRPGGAAEVRAPIDGRLAAVMDVGIGTHVRRGDVLARLLPPATVPGDLPGLQRAQAEARTAVALATRDRARAERLTAAGAAPARRLEEARAAEEQAQARLTAAEASLAQYDAARGGTAAETAGAFLVRAPITGVVARRDATSGANVTAGAHLFDVVDPAQVQIIGDVPEADVARTRQARAAELEVPGQNRRTPLGRRVGIGAVLQPESRTLPIAFAFDNRAGAVAVGQAVALHVLLAEAPPRPIVPAAAVVDDAGRPIVFVQRDGETFERRPVTLGPRTGGRVQILEGVAPGERVVTTGAYLVRLASLSTSVPAHGHAH